MELAVNDPWSYESDEVVNSSFDTLVLCTSSSQDRPSSLDWPFTRTKSVLFLLDSVEVVAICTIPELLWCNFEVSLWCRECQELSSVQSSECRQGTCDDSDSIHQWILPNLRCKQWIFVDPAPIHVGHRSRLCEVEIVDLWPGRFAFGHIDTTQTTPGLCLQHKIDLEAPVTWLSGPQCQKQHWDPEAPVH